MSTKISTEWQEKAVRRGRKGRDTQRALVLCREGTTGCLLGVDVYIHNIYIYIYTYIYIYYCTRRRLFIRDTMIVFINTQEATPLL